MKILLKGSRITISEAIKRIKESREKLTRLIKIQKDNFTLLIPTDCDSIEKALANDPKLISFEKLEGEIQRVSEEISLLRESVDDIAHNTEVTVDGKRMTLSMLRLRVETLRSDIDRITKLKERGGFRVRLTVDDKEHEIDQLSGTELETMLDAKIVQKRQLDPILEKTNVNTDFVL